ncbi:hypothetical protein SAMN05421823_111179 [Catalinimonas alkaloidigena]|uniref:Uncharacterized protein n=1 Tax=Catalinimonas alkaloidigena TaxID=1075417 RepID=A0A1G9RKG6_9BACT|nr:hypothetical protein [Catalinimonas alkaloidigena]SDM23407.1 hypothetical protein SAMN05421823_111179 [Catalinimonas alkaloidigena]
MKTREYNPSPLEVTFINIIHDLQDEIQERLQGVTVVEATKKDHLDNPQLVFTLMDQDGDEHELVMEFIQRPDVSLGSLNGSPAQQGVPMNLSFNLHPR